MLFPRASCAAGGFSSFVFGEHLTGKPASSPSLIMCPVSLIPALAPSELYHCINIKGEICKSPVNYRHSHFSGRELVFLKYAE